MIDDIDACQKEFGEQLLKAGDNYLCFHDIYRFGEQQMTVVIE